MSPFDYILPVALGIGLAAATGFRVFVPLLVAGLAAREGYLPLSEGFMWVTTTPALLMLAIAALAEVAAYYIPVIDNLLDGIAGPTAIGAGIAVSYAVMGDLPPMIKWTLAIIAGGGAAAATQGATTLLRGTSTVLTAGLGNSVLSTGELVGALLLSLLAILLPILAAAAAVVLIIVIWRFVTRTRRSPPAGAPQ
ncbi:MAG: DUF4126 domain-containing protein [Proteobacteria bacterium]|nr:DUF4126 domain-containing protein [Pseudomonadota bacterium]